MQKARSHALNRAPTACKHMVSGSFNSASSGSFHLSIALLCTIGHQRVFSLAGWTPRIQTGLLVSRPTQDAARLLLGSCTELSSSMVELSRSFHSQSEYHVAVLQPLRCVATTQVWAPPRSLAATGGIILIFFSCGY